MLITDKIPSYIYDLLKSRGVDTDKIMLASYCDMNDSHIYCDTYVLATAEKLIVLSGSGGLENGGRAGKIDKVWREEAYREYNVEEIEKLKLEELSSSARLVAKMKSGEYIFLTAMTNTCRSSLLCFIKYFEKMKRGEIKGSDFEIDPEDDPSANRCPKCGMRYPDKNRKICPRCMEKGKLYKRFATFLFKYKKYVGVMLLSLILLTATGILAPYLSNEFFYDEVLNEGGGFFGEVLLVIALIVGTRLLGQLFSIVNGLVSARISAKVVFDLKMTVFKSIERLSMSFFNGRQTGGLMTQVNNDSNTIYYFFCDGIPYFLINIVQVVVVCVILFIENPLLAALSLATVPIFFFIILRSYRHETKLHAKNYSGSRAVNSQLSDVLGGIRVVKAFSQENAEIRRFNKTSKKAAKYQKNLSLFNNYVYPSLGLVLYLGNIIALGVGGWMVISGYNDFSYGKLLKFVAYVNMIYSPMYFFADMIDWSAQCTNALQRLYEIYDTEPDITEKPDAITPEEIFGNVEFRNVEFSYVKNRKIIDGVSFDVKAGKTLGIVGHTGAGKSTIVNLLMRLYDCNEGEIFVDGINVKDLSFKSLYENISIVSQETYFFIGSILDNIKYAKPDATREEVIKAAKLAGAHSFIMKLPEAYNTMIGFGYKDLSGGEKQRLSIARAILRDPKILILDEATAAMDTETEQMIQNAITALTKDKTTIMIAHRLSTLRDADELIVIEHGKVAERGTHKELLAIEGGVYNKLYTLQSEALKNAGITE
ncbi:MAG: ABC transporter ATP-binding protein [Clostridia bacterium]|nr:ABC transporter ATP-binding protein [Clostridia bacterium]